MKISYNHDNNFNELDNNSIVSDVLVIKGDISILPGSIALQYNLDNLQNVPGCICFMIMMCTTPFQFITLQCTTCFH